MLVIFKAAGSCIAKGLKSIAEGMSTFSIYPNSDYEAIAKDLGNKYHHLNRRPVSQGSCKQDRDALASDWQAVARDFGGVMAPEEPRTAKTGKCKP